MSPTIVGDILSFARFIFRSLIGEYLASDQLESLLDGPCDNRFVADLDYRAIQQARIGNYRGDYLVLGRVFGKSELLKPLFLRPEQPEGGNPEFLQQ